MDMKTIIIFAVLAVVLVLLTVAATRYASRQAPSKLEQSAEEAAFAAMERGIEMLADKSGEQQEIAAAQARMAMKDKLLGQAMQKLQAKAPLPPITQ